MGLASAHYTNNTLSFFSNKASSPSLIPEDANQPYITLLLPVEFWPTLKKAFYDGFYGGWEPTLILTKAKNQEGPENSRSDNPLQHSQVAIGNLLLRWLLGSLPLAMNHTILGTDLPHNIDESTYFCLWIDKSILIP